MFRGDWTRFSSFSNWRVIVERYTFPNGVVGGSIPAVKSSLYVVEIKLSR